MTTIKQYSNYSGDISHIKYALTQIDIENALWNIKCEHPKLANDECIIYMYIVEVYNKTMLKIGFTSNDRSFDHKKDFDSINLCGYINTKTESCEKEFHNKMCKYKIPNIKHKIKDGCHNEVYCINKDVIKEFLNIQDYAIFRQNELNSVVNDESLRLQAMTIGVLQYSEPYVLNAINYAAKYTKNIFDTSKQYINTKIQNIKNHTINYIDAYPSRIHQLLLTNSIQNCFLETPMTHTIATDFIMYTND